MISGQWKEKKENFKAVLPFFKKKNLHSSRSLRSPPMIIKGEANGRREFQQDDSIFFFLSLFLTFFFTFSWWLSFDDYFSP